jgi:hypothetical protein
VKCRLIIYITLAACLCAGCSTLFAPQQLSDNYARAAGAKCDAPEVVDGDLETISNRTRIEIHLPEEKSIRRVVIHSLNVSNLTLYGSTGREREWKLIRSIKGNKLPKLVIETQMITDKVRIFISDTRGSSFADPGDLKDVDGYPNEFSVQVDAKPQIQEIELYGLEDKVKIKPKTPIF